MEYVYDMTWAEFRIRLFAFKRIRLYETSMVREIAWNSLISSSVDPKKLPKNKDLFWSLGDSEKPRVTDVMKQRILEAQEKYKQEKAKKNGS